MTLFNLRQGEKGIITKVKGTGAFRKRIMEMGFVAGREVSVIKRAPLGDPTEYHILGYNVSLRASEAQLVEVATEEKFRQNGEQELESIPHENGTSDLKKSFKAYARRKKKVINIAFVGNPNSGKTSLFNHASGRHERTGNYGGVTVESKEAHFYHDGYQINVTDLPGTYSITAYSPEELYVREYIRDKMPDVVVNVVDASNIERNLYLTTQLIDMDIRVVIALNMYDELEKNGDKIAIEQLAKLLGMPIVPTVGSKGEGVEALLEQIVAVYEGKSKVSRPIQVNYGRAVELAIDKITKEITTSSDSKDLTDRVSPRFIATKLLEKDAETEERIASLHHAENIKETVNQQINIVSSFMKEDTESIITDARYGFIAGALKETYQPSQKKRMRKSDLIDLIVTHKLYAFPIFLLLMWAMFYLTFTLGAYPMEWIEQGVEWLGEQIHQGMPEGIIKDFLIDGVIGGVGGVIVFLPNIIILYLFISIFEDSGYMARAVFIMDKAMHRIGLHGKSFIPLVMGFGCNVPAIMSTRIIESRRDRIISMFITPFMSCGARLPVYILFISAFFENNQGTILFIIYLSGIILAILSAFLLQKVFFRKEDLPFVMELPPYRIPTLKSILMHVWFNTAAYLKKIGGIVLIASMIIWALGYFPRDVEYTTNYEAKITQLQEEIDHAEGLSMENIATKEKQISSLELMKESEEQRNSYIGKIGTFIAPIMKPLGFDWRMSCAIVAGLPAKEVVVGTLGVLFPPSPGMEAQSLPHRIKSQTILTGPNKGKKLFTPLTAITFMLFILIYFPCIAVVATIKKESGKWKYALFEIFYTTGLAWVVSFLVYQVGSLIL
ncbi:MAG: ferrous iron transport protein B [Bacteroidetes bacterium]|nr:MAG: ferrous iron transport protein B [Bacteroidota bacterium]PIE88268.1 MAG: ferrous iron transport protein B [Bacteroidota bacterium]